jgi:hypothetical protein
LASLGLEARGLVLGVVQFREAVGVLAPGDEELEAFGDGRVAVDARASGDTSTG